MQNPGHDLPGLRTFISRSAKTEGAITMSIQTESSSRKSSWRDILPIHPAAELFPRMSPDELKALGEDIKATGLTSAIVLMSPSEDDTPVLLLDGRNRLDAMELVGLQIVDDHDRLDVSRIEYVEPSSDPYAYVISANIHRRHLTAEQKRDLIAKLIKATPEKSDRQIAETVKASPTTVGTVRAEMEATGDVSKLDTRTDSKGRKQPARKTTTKPAPGSEEVVQ